MDIRFTLPDGSTLHWDGLLWRCEAMPDFAAGLNREALPEGGPHHGVLDRAAALLDGLGGRTVTREILDDTGWPEEWIGEDCLFPEDELAGPPPAGHFSSDDESAKAIVERGALAAAEAHLWRGVCADAEIDEDSEWDAPEREWQALVEWCRQTGLIPEVAGPLHEGGREHDVSFDEATGRWWKWTKPSLSGYTVDWTEDGEPWLRNARPQEYLKRLLAQNRLLQDDIRLEGVWRDPRGWRIVTSQPDVPGSLATMEQIHSGLESLGFVRLRWDGIGYEHSTSWRLGWMCVWDVHPANVVRAASGLIVPVDVIITPLPGGWPPCHFHA